MCALKAAGLTRANFWPEGGHMAIGTGSTSTVVVHDAWVPSLTVPVKVTRYVPGVKARNRVSAEPSAGVKVAVAGLALHDMLTRRSSCRTEPRRIRSWPTLTRPSVGQMA